MSDLERHIERLSMLMNEMAEDDIDPMDAIFSIVLEYAEDELYDDEDKTLKIEYDDKILVISIELLPEPTERLH